MSIPAEIAAAIVATTRATGKLIKNEHNKHGGYAFVGVDTYYERVASKAAENGLSWVARETAFSVIEVSGKNGLVPLVQATYEFDVFHESGASAPQFSRITLIHPVQGPQTVGSLVSYLDKVFQRQTFKLATGEKGDADEADPRSLEDIRSLPASKPANDPPRRDAKPDVKDVVARREDGKPVFKEPSDSDQAKLMEEIFTKFVDVCETFDELKGFWNSNAAPLEALKKLDVDAYVRVKDAFTGRRQVVQKEKRNG